MTDTATALRDLRDDYAGSMWPNPTRPSQLWQADFIAICETHIKRAERNRKTRWEQIIPERIRHWWLRNT